MKIQDASRGERIPPECLAEAGVWIARLHGEDRDRAMEEGFRQWLQASPLNGRAFELATEAWEESQNLRRVVPFAHEVPPAAEDRRRFKWPLLAGAAAATLAMVAAGIVLYLRSAGVSTEVGEQRLLALEDGTRVFLNTATRVVVRYDQRLRQVELETGEALFDVAKKPDWPFVVTVGKRQVRALGTSFVVRYDGERTAVTLVEGKVSVSPESRTEEDAGTTLSAGQRLTFAAGKQAKLDTPPLEKAIAWRRGQVILDDTPLSNAVAEMNRYSPVKLVLQRPEASGVLVNGLFQAGDSSSFAHAVAKAYELHILEQERQIILY